METQNFNALRTLTIDQFKTEMKLSGISLFKGKNGTYFVGEKGFGHKGSVCFLSKKAQLDPMALKTPVVSEFYKVDEKTGEVSKTETYWCLHEQGGMESVMDF